MADSDGPEASSVVSFHLADQVFAIDARYVAEVLPNAWLARPPGLPAMVAGLLDLGGEAVTVLRGDLLLDLPRQRFGLDASILVFKGTKPRVGLLTGRVESVCELGGLAVRVVAAEHSFRGSVRGQVTVGGVDITVLDWPSLLDAEEQARLDEFTARAAERLAAWHQPP